MNQKSTSSLILYYVIGNKVGNIIMEELRNLKIKLMWGQWCIIDYHKLMWDFYPILFKKVKPFQLWPANWSTILGF